MGKCVKFEKIQRIKKHRYVAITVLFIVSTAVLIQKQSSMTLRQPRRYANAEQW